MDHLCYLCLVFVLLSRLFIAALWSHAGKGLTFWPVCVMLNCTFVTFLCGIQGQVRYWIVFTYSSKEIKEIFQARHFMGPDLGSNCLKIKRS